MRFIDAVHYVASLLIAHTAVANSSSQRIHGEYKRLHCSTSKVGSRNPIGVTLGVQCATIQFYGNDFLLVINCTRGRILYRWWDIPSTGPKSLYFDTPLAFNIPAEGVPLGRSCKILHGGQRMANVVHNGDGDEILPKGSIPWVGCTNVTDRWICNSNRT